ncbi:MAG TPA: DUF58 domain-containing protein [Opitutaceae bacterium]|jgi:uncharacterized protein (DUF58 family)|nr:DUF58 domain-containing protein [Opitutaceae bacterium]
MTTKTGVMAADWGGPGSSVRWWRDFKWSTLLWSLVFPARPESIAPTVPGLLLIALSLGIGSAAYNTGNNILFIALALLLSCLILSGVLSWLNFSGLRWRLATGPALRVGRDAAVALELRSEKKILPTYGLWFDLRAVNSSYGTDRTYAEPGEKKSVREILAAVDKAETRARLFLHDRLDAGEEAHLEWIFQPARRGVLRLELAGVGSLFPFGFLRKTLRGGLRRELVVWPAPVEYRGGSAATVRRPQAGEHVARVGSSADLLALRRYESGDSHRLIHWKASARLGKLVVRQFAAERAEGFTLWLRTPAEVWTRSEQFELLVSFAATLAEDLFRAGKLRCAAVNDEPPVAVRGVRDLEEFMDKLAVVESIDGERRKAEGEKVFSIKQNLITFAPDGARGVAAYVDGEKTAAA